MFTARVISPSHFKRRGRGCRLQPANTLPQHPLILTSLPYHSTSSHRLTAASLPPLPIVCSCGMTAINVTNVVVLNNPAPFTDPFEFEITFECYPPGLQEELEWKLIYVGSAEDEGRDQELDSVLVGPVSIGRNKFVFTAPAPDCSLIPDKDVMEVTVILLTALYREKEFIRIGYYVNTEYPEREAALRADWEDYRSRLEDRFKKEQQVAQHKLDLQAWRLAHPTAAAASASASAAPSASPSASPPPVSPSTPPPAFEPIELPPIPALPPIRPAVLQRSILANAPRVTRFQIAWDDAVTAGRMDRFVMDEGDEKKAKEAEERIVRGEEREGADEQADDDDGDDRGGPSKRRRLDGQQVEAKHEAGGGKEEKAVAQEEVDEEDEDEEDDDDDDVVDALSDNDEVTEEKRSTAAAVAPASSH